MTRDPHHKDCGIRTRGICDCGYLDFVSEHRNTLGAACGDCRFGIRHMEKLKTPAPLGYCVMHSVRISYRTPACKMFQWRQPTTAKGRV